MSNQFLTHPQTGRICFGTIIEMNSRGYIIPAGEIRLLSGKHVGPHQGWGAKHIWAEHRLEMQKQGLHTYAEVPAYVSSIVSQGTSLYFEGNIRKIRIMGVRAATGTAVLEFRKQREGAIWSVITAHSGVKRHGTLVGTVR